jgi:hypothetical protein
VRGFYFSNLKLSLRPGPRQTVIFFGLKKVSADEQYRGGKGAMRSVEGAVEKTT